MKKLKRIVLVQFFLYDANQLDVEGHIAFLGLNGSGKTSLLDAIQIAMLGAHGKYLAFNTQSVGSTGGRRNPRSIRDYCLGVTEDTGEGNSRLDRKRDSAISYITLVFEDDATREPVSIGACIRAEADEKEHELLGLYVLPGQALNLNDHLERGDAAGDMLPLMWNDFEAAARARSAQGGGAAFFGTEPTKYINEMIHALQPKAKSIDVREYLKVFNKSVKLRNIESVDSFVRDYVIEPQSLDRRRARAQIDHFKELSRMLEQVRQQIANLTELSSLYDEVGKYVVRVASTEALASAYDADEATRSLSGLEAGLRTEFGKRRMARRAAAALARDIKVASDARDEAIRVMTSQPGANDLSNYAAAKLRSERTLLLAHRRIENDMVRLAEVTAHLAGLKSLPGGRNAIKEANRALAHHENRLGQGLVTGADEAVVGAVRAAQEAVPHLEVAKETASSRRQQAENRCLSLAGQIRNAEKNGAPISEEVAYVISRLAYAGIVAEPVCSLVQVSDPAWQPAIEAFLKSNRESLVIADGREREAIRLIREMSDRDNPYAAKVVQPHHFKDRRWDDRDETLVGNLFAGDNPVALAYLRALTGSMKRVETEEELERHSRALTVDGMLSANFTTSRLRLVSADKLLFGKQLTYADKERLRKEAGAASEEETRAAGELKAIERGLELVARLGDLEELCRRTSENVSQAIDDQAEVARVDGLMARIDAGNLTLFRDDYEQKDHTLNELKRQLEKIHRQAHEAETVLRGQFPRRSILRRQRDEKVRRRGELMAGPDIDPAWIERVRGEIGGSSFGATHEGRMQTCANRVAAASKSADDAKTNALIPFQGYLSHYNISLDAELKDWRLGRDWVKNELARLKGTELVERQSEVDVARYAAEEAFRNDVAVNISGSIKRMHDTIADINKTLATCPPFSNGERYRFVVKPIEAHKDLHEYILNVGRSSERDFFLNGSDTHAKIMALLDDSGDKGETNPLDDYRLLFSFDLMIDREGKPSIPLSRRLGVGSNGEHRTPFYVIAGAAMAAAYRIDAGKHSTGAGLMLLDEAFHGMDQQNALSAARFLDSIGLQMVMAAPEADHSKLAPTLDTIFEITKFDQDVFVERTSVKEAAHRLLTSDMPSEHPDLLAGMIEQLKAETT